VILHANLIWLLLKNEDRAAFARGQKPNPPKTYHFDAEKLGKIGYILLPFFIWTEI